MEDQQPEKRPVGRPRKITDIDELYRAEIMAQLELAKRIREFTEARLDALEESVKGVAGLKQELEVFKAANSANVEAQKITQKTVAERPKSEDDNKKGEFNLEAFLKEQQ